MKWMAVAAVILCALGGTEMAEARGEAFDIAGHYLPGYTYGSVLGLYALGEDGMLCHISAQGDEAAGIPTGELLVRYDGAGGLLWHHAFESWPETERGGSRIMLLPDGRFARAVFRTNSSAYVQYFDRDKGHTGQTPVFDADLIMQQADGFIVPAAPAGGAQRIQRVDWDGNVTASWAYAHDGDIMSGARAAFDVEGGMLLLDNDHSSASHMAVYKVDGAGNVLWVCRFPGNGGFASAMLPDGEGGAVVYGYYMLGDAQKDVVFRVASGGTLLWAVDLDVLGETYFSDLIATQGGWYLVGHVTGGIARCLLTPEGIITDKDVRATLFEDGTSRLQFGVNAMAALPDGGLLLGGNTWRDDGDIWQYWPTVIPFDAMPTP